MKVQRRVDIPEGWRRSKSRRIWKCNMQTILNLRDATVSHSVGEGEVLSIVLLSNDFLQWDCAGCICIYLHLVLIFHLAVWLILHMMQTSRWIFKAQSGQFKMQNQERIILYNCDSPPTLLVSRWQSYPVQFCIWSVKPRRWKYRRTETTSWQREFIK